MKQGLKKVYEGVHGKKYILQSYTEKYAFLRGDNYGHIDRIMVARDSETGEVDPRLTSVSGYVSGSDPVTWMAQRSEHVPAHYVDESIQQTVDAAKDCNNCSEEEIRAWNIKRLEESQRLREESNKS